MFLQSSPLSSSVVRMEFGREVFHDGLEPLDASRLAQGEKVCCATPAFHKVGKSHGGVTKPTGEEADFDLFGPGPGLELLSGQVRAESVLQVSQVGLSRYGPSEFLKVELN